MATLLGPLIDAEKWFLEELHALRLGWGLAIVAMTVFVRIGTVPLTIRQVRSSANFSGTSPS